MKNLFNIFIFCASLTSAVVHADDLVQWSLPQTQKADEEFLLYRLSYSGFFTAFIWKDLADTVIVADNQSHTFNKQKTCQLNLKMSTEDFLISELVLPMRFHWRTTVSPDLSRIFLIEEINKNKDNSHKVVWVNQKKKQLEIYHKRQKVSLSAPVDDYFDDDDSFEEQDEVKVWEKDGAKKAPDFLLNEPRIEARLDYLVYDKTVKISKNTTVFDPLSLIYSARWYDYGKVKKVDFTVVYKDGFRKYQVFYEAREKLEIGSKTVDVIRIEIRRNKDEARSDEGFMVIWLSDDERRIPLQYLVEVELGTIKLQINPSNLENYQTPVNCIAHKLVSTKTSVVNN